MAHLSDSKKVLQSSFLNISGGILQTIIRLVASLFLARALDPRDFGLMGLAVTFNSLFSFIGRFGADAGIIVKKEIDSLDCNICFWMMTITRLCIFLLVFFLAPMASSFFRVPQLSLIIRLLSFTFLFSIISIMPSALLTRELNLKPIVVASVVSVFLESSLAILLAEVFHYGVYSLVYAALLSSLVKEMLVFISRPWLPRLHFSFKKIHYFYKFGFNNLLLTSVNYLLENIDLLIVGRLLGPKLAGMYEFAYRIPNLLRERLLLPIIPITMSFFSKRNSVLKELFYGYSLMSRYVLYLIGIPLIYVFVAADLLVPVLWGVKWVGAILPLRVLAIAVIFRGLFSLINPLLLAIERPDIPVKFSILKLVAFTILLLVFVPYFKLLGASFAVLCLSIFDFFIFAYICKYFALPTSFSFGLFLRFLQAPAKLLFAELFILLMVKLFVQNQNVYSSLFLVTFSFCFLMVLLVFIFSSFKNDLFFLLKVLKNDFE